MLQIGIFTYDDVFTVYTLLQIRRVRLERETFPALGGQHPPEANDN